MTNPNIQIDDLVRPMNAEEFKDYKASQLAGINEQESLDAAAAVRVSALAKLKKLGLTQAEVESL